MSEQLALALPAALAPPGALPLGPEARRPRPIENQHEDSSEWSQMGWSRPPTNKANLKETQRDSKRLKELLLKSFKSFKVF